MRRPVPFVTIFAVAASVVLAAGSASAGGSPESGGGGEWTANAQREACAMVDRYHLEMQTNQRAALILALCNGSVALDPGALSGRQSAVSADALGALDINLITGGEGAYPNVTQSGGQLWANGSTIVAAYSDSRSRNATPICIVGGSRSTDGGATWTNTHPFCGDPAANYGWPTVAYDAAFSKWFAVILSAACGSAGLGTWSSTDNGTTWSRTGCVHSGASDDRPSMWVDNNPASPFYGRVYVSFNDFNRGGGQLFVRRSTDGGLTWAETGPLAASFRRNVGITTAPNGSIYVAAMDEGGGGFNNRTNFVHRSTDGGVTWAESGGPPFPAPGRAICGYFAGMYESPVAGYWRHMGWGDIGVGPDTVVHLTYAAHGATTDPGDVYYTRSTDTGITWGAALKLNTDSSTRGQWQPSLAVTPGGHVFVSWYDERNTTAENGYQRFGRLSLDNGASWQADGPVSDVVSPKPLQVDPGIVPCFAGDYDRAYGAAGVFHTAWTDGRVVINDSNQQDVFYDDVTVASAVVLPPCVSQPFSDVAVSHPFCKEIKWVKDAGVSTGFGDGTYRPADDVTRQAMAAFMARLAGVTPAACSSPPFIDVPVGHPFCKEIKWLKGAGISTGFGDGTFRPADPVTRQAMAAFMARLATATLTPCTSTPFGDVAVTHPFCKEIKWLKEVEVSTGFPGGTYRPSDVVTRQAMAAFLARLQRQQQW